MSLTLDILAKGIMRIIKLLLLLVAIHNTEAFFGKKLQEIKDKARKLYKSKYGKDKTWHFLGHDLSEYPGRNNKYRDINKQKWDDYYKCLHDQNSNLGKFLSITPEAVLGYEGSNVKFDCKICISPQERQNVDSIEWDWAPVNATHLDPIEFTEHIFQSPMEKSLHLYNLQSEHTGQYICRLGDSLSAPYFLTVISVSDDNMIEVHSKEAPLGPYPKDVETIQGYKMILDTEWSEWSICSKCDKIGKKHKLGYCALYLEGYKELTPELNNNINETNPMEKTLIKEIDLELFSIFKLGIPCDSHILSKSIKEQPQVKARKGEIMSGFCKVQCPKNEIYEVKDKNGKVLEKANNSAGIYSLQQSLPPLEPPIERRLQYGVKGKVIIIICPSNMNSDAPIHWQIGSKNLVPAIITEESKGRIFISITDRVHIKNSRISDSNIYSCWQQSELVATIRLIVEKKLELNFNHHLMLLGIIIILSTFLYVCVKAFFGRKYAKT